MSGREEHVSLGKKNEWSALEKQNSRGTKLVDVWRGKWVGRRLGW